MLKDVLAKIEEYFCHGVRQVWLIEPHARKVDVYDSGTSVRILADTETLDNTVVPGFALPLRKLFQEAL